MDDRLLRLLDVEQLSSSKFADVIGVQRSSVSHILSGRNKPSFDFLQKTLKAFPVLNADWLILGEGKMYETGENIGSGSLFDQAEKTTEGEELNASDKSTSSPTIDSLELNIPKLGVQEHENGSPERENTTVSERSTEKIESKIVARVILLYTDNSFDSYNPGE